MIEQQFRNLFEVLMNSSTLLFSGSSNDYHKYAHPEKIRTFDHHNCIRYSNMAEVLILKGDYLLYFHAGGIFQFFKINRNDNDKRQDSTSEGTSYVYT